MQVSGTNCLALQWTIIYVYTIMTKSNPKSSEQLAIEQFAFILFNYIYYLNNVKSFFLCMMSSRLFRKTSIEFILKLTGQWRHIRQQRLNINTMSMIDQRVRKKILNKIFFHSWCCLVLLLVYHIQF